VQLIEPVLVHTCSNKSTDIIERENGDTEDEFLDDEEEDEISSEQDTSDSEDSREINPEHGYIEQSLQVLFIPDEEIGQVNM
jgi:hypothetical protein